jgi:TrmH family RNA methyltransferase
MTEDTTADVITSRENRWVKLFRAGLRGSGPSGDEPIALEGPKLIEEAVCYGLEADAVLVSESGERRLEAILRAASASESGIARSRVLRTTDKIFESLSGTESPQGVAALFRQPAWDFDDILGLTSTSASGGAAIVPLVLVLAGVQDPGNVGTILRSAEAFGATGAVVTRGAADPWSPKAVRASAGSALRLPLLRGMSMPVLLAQLRVSKIKIVASSSCASNAASEVEHTQPALRESVAIFIGNEGAGLAHEVESAADQHFTIPMARTVESLNAGIAASIILYEAARQRKDHHRTQMKADKHR